MWYSNLGKKHLFLDISCTNIDTLVPSLYQCVKILGMEVFWLLSQPLPPFPFQPLRQQRNYCHLVVNRFTRQTLPTVNKKHFVMNILCIKFFFLQETHNRTLLFCSMHHKDRHDFGYWNQPLNMRMLVYYLDCHEAGLCCYLVIHTENQLHPLQLFYTYFILWSIYWLSVVNTKIHYFSLKIRREENTWKNWT
jgi:hypothetical protein